MQETKTLIVQVAEQGVLEAKSGAGVTRGSPEGPNKCRALVQVCGAWAVPLGWFWSQFCEFDSSLSEGFLAAEMLSLGPVQGA